MTDKATTPSNGSIDISAQGADTYRPTDAQLSRRASVREARHVLGQGGLSGTFGGDRNPPQAEHLIDLAEYIDSGNILVRDLETVGEVSASVIRTYGTAPVAGVKPEPDFGETPEPASLSDLLKQLEPKPVLKIDVEQLAKMPDEGVEAFIKESRRLIKHKLRDRVEEARDALHQVKRTEETTTPVPDDAEAADVKG